MQKNGHRLKEWFGTCLAVLTVFALVNTLPPNEAHAIPALARKFQTSCLTCHTMTPRLNSFGEAVRLNGFRWPEPDPELRAEVEEQMTKEEKLKLGEEAYKKAWPDAVWPGDIPKTVPIGMRWRPYWTAVHDKGDNLDKIRWEWELFAAGTIGDNAHAFGHFNVEGGVDDSLKTDGTIDSKKDGAIIDTKIVGWLAHENYGKYLGLPEDLINFRLGVVMMEEQDIPFYRSHSTYRMDTTKSLYLDDIPYPKNFTGDPKIFNDITGEQNQFKMKRGPGIEMYGFTPRFHYATAFMTGMDVGGGTDQQTGSFYMTYKIGGMDNYGRTKKKFSHGHQEYSLGLGVIGWLGQAKVKYQKEARVTDDFWRLGLGAKLTLKDLALHAGTVFGKHDNPYGTLDRGRLETNWFFVAPEYYFFPWLMAAVRYEEEAFKAPAAVGLGDQNAARFHPYIGILLKPNIRFVIAGNYYRNKRHDTAGKALDFNDTTFSIDMTF